MPFRAILNVVHAIWLYAGVAVPKAIQIRDVPDDVHAVLKTRAAAAGMSMSEFLRSELITMASKPTLAELLARVRTRHGGASRENIVRAVRETRGELPET